MDSNEIFDINEKKVTAVATTSWVWMRVKETCEIHFEGGYVLTFPLKSAILRKSAEDKE